MIAAFVAVSCRAGYVAAGDWRYVSGPPGGVLMLSAARTPRTCPPFPHVCLASEKGRPARQARCVWD